MHTIWLCSIFAWLKGENPTVGLAFTLCAANGNVGIITVDKTITADTTTILSQVYTTLTARSQPLPCDIGYQELIPDDMQKSQILITVCIQVRVQDSFTVLQSKCSWTTVLHLRWQDKQFMTSIRYSYPDSDSNHAFTIYSSAFDTPAQVHMYCSRM